MDPFKKGNYVPPCNNYWHRSLNGIVCLDICNDNYPYLVPNIKEWVISCLDIDDSENKYFFGNNNFVFVNVLKILFLMELMVNVMN